MRFSGFNTNWEQRKLGDVCIINNGKDYKHLNKGTIPVYGTGGVLTKVNSALSYDKDAVGIGRKGTINKPFILNAPFWTVDTLFYVIPNKYISLYFLFILFQQIKWNKLDESTGVPSLSKENIKVVNIKLPSKSEMIKISKFIFLLDKKIELHQSKLEALKKIKSIYLRYLFPEKG
ncbi:restriction endonuclease subunit S [Veillonella criceti]|uniref:restriction endonuclease subunit S n=1 Tax=Veillonella criceti TaxID=103891 RepID=UPI002481B30E|nr:restriction endonuclease subunit S [Veillonella criceti]